METLTTLFHTILESGIILDIAILILAVCGNKKSAAELQQIKSKKLKKKATKYVGKAKKAAQKAEKLEEELKNASSVPQ